MDELLSDFLVETQRRLAFVESRFDEFLRAPAEAQIQADILELLHTVKGASVLLALPRLEAIAHAAEIVLIKARSGAIDMSPAAAALIVESVGVIRRIQRVIATSGVEPGGDDAALLDDLSAAASGRPLKRPSPPQPTPTPQVAPTPPSSAARSAAQQSVGQLGPVRPSVSIPLEHIERLASLVGDLVLTRNSLNHLLGGRDDAELEEVVQRLGNITSDLGLCVMSARRQASGWTAESASGMFEIMSAVSIECAGSCYAIPQRSVLELVRVTPSDRAVSSDEVRLLRLRERRYPWLRLASLLGLARDRASGNGPEVVVMIDAGNGPVGLAVDHIIDIEEIVVRPLPSLLKDSKFFVGTTILSDSAVAMVLEPRNLSAEVERGRTPKLTQPGTVPRLRSEGQI